MVTPIITQCQEEEEEVNGSAFLAQEEEEEEEEESLYGEDEDDDDLGLCARPIVVGYAFGPKKMSTMGVVMAEASKTTLSRTTNNTTTYSCCPTTITPTGDANSPLLNNLAMMNATPEVHIHGDTTSSSRGTSSQLPNGPLHQTLDSDRDAMPSPGEVGQLTQAILSNYNGIPATHLDNQQQQRMQINTALDTSERSTYSHDSSSSPCAARLNLTATTPSTTARRSHRQQDSVVFTVDNGLVMTGSASGGGNPFAGLEGDVGLRNIVRYFRSSCSSVADSVSTGTCTASASSTTGSQRTVVSTTTTRPTLSSSGSSSKPSSNNKRQQQSYPVRVSFVPLDMEIPLEDQHGGQMDVILHKLTEDILCLSQLSMTHPELKNLTRLDSFSHIEQVLRQNCTPPFSQSSSNTTAAAATAAAAAARRQLTETELAALRRVHRLSQFQQNHPACSLVDDPTCVQTLMSRSDIAQTLQACLHKVTSKSGIPVGSPKFVVLPAAAAAAATALPKQPLQQPQHSAPTAADSLVQLIQQAGLSFPIIVKPLIAAGTKASHAMAVLLEADALPAVIVETTPPPCLCQEYSNHDSLLYKVYVLGHHVSVHKRRSLPNLPRDGRKSQKGFLAFDSQRPYPRLADFGFEDKVVAATQLQPTADLGWEGSNDNNNSNNSAVGPQLSSSDRESAQNDSSNAMMQLHATKRRKQQSNAHVVPQINVTAEEIQPIVDALKGAFGLELFGFDVLITSQSDDDDNDDDERCQPRRRMLVVDVNYFPSYKEVRNFPALLAQYLTDRAIECRRSTNPSL